MPHTVMVEVFKFDELSDTAKERAREWYREASAQDEWWEFIYDDAAKMAEILGIELRQKRIETVGGDIRYEPAIYFGDMYSQGGGACFEGSYAYAKGCARKIRREAPAEFKDRHGKTQHSKGNAMLAGIADGLVELQKRHAYKLTATVKHSGHYMHENCTEIDVEYDGDSYSEHPISQEDEKKLAELLREFMRWIYKQLVAEYEYQNSDEVVDDNITANEYDFDEDGERFTKGSYS